MRYADEVLPREGLLPEEAATAEPSERELAMARQLVEALSGPFDATRYHDEYREQLMGLIEKKAAGEEIVAEPTVEEPGKVVDLMAALEASLARAGAPAESGADADEDAAPAKRARKRPARTRKSA
jgi:DNA end-binding protein Ku